MNKVEVEQLLRALTGGQSPSIGDTIVFGEEGWKYGVPLVDGSTLADVIEDFQAQIDALDARVTALETP
jgi:hypothetical protein